jgi:hypothetical protein
MKHETETIMSKAVAEKVTTASLVASNDNLPAHLQLVENGVGRGNENVGANVVIPRVKLLQKMSDEVDIHHAKYVEGCQPGHFVNTLTGFNYGSEIYAISLTFNTEFVVWRQLDAGGGYGGAFPSRAAAQDHVNQQDKPADYDINETHAHVLLLKDPNTGELDRTPCIMDFASSKLRVSKNWNSQIGMQGGDRFAGLWKVAGVSTENKMGHAFMNLDVSWVGWAMEDDYKAAEALYEQHSHS